MKKQIALTQTQVGVLLEVRNGPVVLAIPMTAKQVRKLAYRLMSFGYTGKDLPPEIVDFD